MKYNKDIHPIKKKIGLLLEQTLKEHLKECVGYSFVTVDFFGYIVIHKTLPSQDDFGHNSRMDFFIEILEYSISDYDYIQANWKDLVFRLNDEKISI